MDWGYENFDGIDAKLPWELSRFGHLVTLAQAGFLTGQKNYLEEIVIQLEDWRRHNPPGYGINWANTMEVGIRAHNVLFALGLIWDELSHDGELAKRIEAILPPFVFHHAKHILKNLEAPTNHLLGDLIGLARIAEGYPYFKDSARWGDFSRKEFSRQMELQVYSDGMDFEGSTSYHRLVTEFFLSAWILWKKRGHPIPSAYTDQLTRMIQAISVFTKNNGDAVQIGDNDSGRLWNLNPQRRLLDYSYLTTRGAPEALWLGGPEPWKTWQERSTTNDQPQTIYQELPHGGIYSAKNHAQDHLLVVSLGRNGQLGWGGHAHNDRLGFHLTLYH